MNTYLELAAYYFFMNTRQIYSLIIVIVTSFSPFNVSAAAQANASTAPQASASVVPQENASTAPLMSTSTLDRQIENIKDLYALYDGWSLSLRASGSLSSQNAYHLAQVNKRLDDYLADTGGGLKPGGNGINLTVGVLDEIFQQYGSAASTRINAWQRLGYYTQGLSQLAKLEKVNRFFNRLAFKSDQENWGKSDYWTSPVELLISNAGDCEDFAIAKYLTLKAMGVEIDRLRITYVKAVVRGKPHMVLAYYEDGSEDPLILDNLNSKILPATKRPGLMPVFSFNG